MNIHRLKLKHRFLILLSTFFIGFAVYGAVSFLTLNALKVNGPLYQDIVQNKDLVADVLPPPEYIIESYLVTLQMMAADGPAQGRLVERLKVLKGEYDTRHEVWVKARLDAQLGPLLLQSAHTPAMAFYDAAFGKLVPALAAGDHAGAATVMQGMAALYEEHRKAIDEVVRLAVAGSERDEAKGARQIDTALLAMLGVLACSLGAGMAVAWYILRGLLHRLGGEPDYAADICRQVAAGRLDVAVQVRGDQQGSLLASIRAMQQTLAGTVSGIQSAADTLALGTSEISAGNEDLAVRTEQQTASLEEAARAVQALTDNVHNNARDAEQASALARTASSIAEDGGVVVGDVVRTMERISASSAKIVDIIGVIDGIAFQTNILALNAAVEAARAGEQGRGFAVVAGELRSLAQRSATAAKEIKVLIDASVQQMQAGSTMVGQAGNTMVKVVSSVREVSDIIGRISTASQEQSDGIERVHQSVNQMETVAVQNAALVEEAAAAAASLREQAEALKRTVGNFSIGAEWTGAGSAGISSSVVPGSAARTPGRNAPLQLPLE